MLMGKFEFVRLASLRAAQLMRGCTARVPERHKRTTTALREIAAGKVIGSPLGPAIVTPADTTADAK